MRALFAGPFCAALSLATPLAAQTPAAAPEKAAPAQAAPDAAPAPDAVAERQRNSAAKLAGMVRFVDASCPKSQPDYARFKQVIAAMGVDIKELEQGTLLVRSMEYGKAYQKDTAESCKRAVDYFGETGTTIPGLIVARKEPKEPAKELAPETPAPAAPAPDAPTPAPKAQ